MKKQFSSFLPALFLVFALFSCSSLEQDKIESNIETAVNASPIHKNTGITKEGEILSSFFDSLNVEKLWPAGQTVNWETGEPDGRSLKGRGSHTHCSAFVASVAKRLDISILMPPAHSAKLLANAQAEWLESEGTKNGWIRIDNAIKAQKMANHGCFVIAVYKNNNPLKSGHIAIIRPSNKAESDIISEGPQIIQAGLENFNSTSTSIGFRHHKNAIKNNQIKYYSYGKGNGGCSQIF